MHLFEVGRSKATKSGKVDYYILILDYTTYCFSFCLKTLIKVKTVLHKKKTKKLCEAC